MILKNIIGAGARGLIDYLSQASKSTTTEHINEYRIPLLHVPDIAINFGARLGKPATGFGDLQTLSRLNVVGEQWRSKVILRPHAPHHLELGRAGSTVEVRRPGDQPGRVGREEAGRSVAPFMTNMAGQTPRELSGEIATLRRLRPNLKKAVSHLVLSHDPTQRKLTVEEWKEAVQIALKEHGAGEAAHAAWRHADTDHDHVHIFFCRILPSGEVVSDSHNYRKNEAAARQIERTFMLYAPTPTSADARPGDRQALDGASRRADRRGTPPPAKVDVKAIRAALAEARDRDHFLQLLAEMGIEAEFDRRGVAREIYGWRLRRVGAAEWLKASTVAKDLSWPKIAHRFAETETMAPVPQTPVAAQAPAPRQEPTDKYARAPAPLRQMLRDQQQQRQQAQTPKPTKRTFEIDMAEVRRGTADLGPLTQAMALLGAVCLKYSLSFLKTLIGWIKKLLAKLGFGVRETQQLVSGPQAVQYQPYTIEGETREVPNAQAAAQLVDQVTAAVEAKDAALLPDVEGRSQVAAELMADPGRQPEQNVLDDIFANDSADAATPAPASLASVPAAPVKSAWVAFSEAAKAYSVAAAAVHQAGLKDIMYFDGRPLARQRHDDAAAEFQELEKVHAGWKTENRLKSALGADPLNLKARAEAAQVRSAQTKAALLKAEKEHAEFETLFEKTPAPTVPFALLDKHAAAAEALNKAQQLLISKARLNLTILDGNPMLRQKREAFGAQLRRAETRMTAFVADPRTQPAAVAELEETLRALAAEVNVERARLTPRRDEEDGQPEDAAGQAVPGQR